MENGLVKQKAKVAVVVRTVTTQTKYYFLSPWFKSNFFQMHLG